MESRVVRGFFAAVFLTAMFQTVSPQSVEVDQGPIPCSTEADCKDHRLPANAGCQSNFCICPDERGVPKNCSSHAEPKTAVYNPAAMGHSCIIDQDCNLPPNGFCNTTNHQCGCPLGYVMASNSWKCLPASPSIGSSCEDVKQCTIGNSTCHEKTCHCNETYHFVDNACWKTLGFGDSCTDDKECNHVENAECNEQSVCACAKSAVLNSDGQRCLPVAKSMLDPCIESTQCSKSFDDSRCIDKRCECMKNNHFDRSLSRCVSSKNLGESCSVDNECFQDMEEGAENPQRCVANVCTCSESFIEADGKCVSSGASSLVSSVFFAIFLAHMLLSTS